MDGSGLDLDLVEYELDQHRRRKAQEATERRMAAPTRIPASAWIPLLIWLTASATAILYFARA